VSGLGLSLADLERLSNDDRLDEAKRSHAIVYAHIFRCHAIAKRVVSDGLEKDKATIDRAVEALIEAAEWTRRCARRDLRAAIRLELKDRNGIQSRANQ
jgi:hypothetical protein